MKFKFTKKKIIAFITTIVVLVGAFWMQDDSPDAKVVEDGVTESSEQLAASNSEELEEDKDQEDTQDATQNENNNNEEHAEETNNQNNEENKNQEESVKVDDQSGKNKKQVPSSEKENINTSEKSTTTNPSESTEREQVIDPETGKDKYQTDPVPEGKPKPVEPEETSLKDEQGTAYLSVRADTAVNNIERIDPYIAELLPRNGIIFSNQAVSFNEGESVYDVLQREMRNAGIHMESSFTPMYNSAYVEGINNLYEFDGGELSGWMYKVNGWFPNYGASRYMVEEGDVIEWVYTMDLGRDVGGYHSMGE